MKKVLLINPEFVRKIDGQTPLNLAYLASAVEPFSEVRIVDLNVRPDSLDEALEEFTPTHVGITRYTPNNIGALEVLRIVRCKLPEAILISGGYHEIFRGHITKQTQPWIDHVVRDRHGEQALLRIVTGDKKATVDWKTLFPAYHLLNMNEQSYRFDPEIFPGKKMLQYMSARGCPLTCSFCPSDNYEALNVDTVIKHLQEIKKMGYQALFFNDVNFAANPKRTRELMQEILRSSLQLEWGCQTIANESLDDDLIRLMAIAGCTYITYSLENVSKEGLKRINKRLDPNIVAHKCRVAKESGMKVGLYVMFGLHQNQDTDFYWVKKTLDKVAEIQPDYVSYSILADYPNCNANLLYETQRFGTEKVWEFFDEGCAFHPHCSLSHAERIKEEILKQHIGQLKHTKIF